MTLDSFPNAKPKLLGEGENSIGVIDSTAVASLSGSSSVSVSDDLNGVAPPTNLSNINEETFGWVSLNPTFGNPSIISLTPNIKDTNSLVIITISMMLLEESGDNVLPVFELKRGTTLLLTINVGEINRIKLVSSIFVDSGVSGNVTYNLHYTSRTDPVSIGIPPSPEDGVIMNVKEIELTDTHVAFISTPATATKQIITPDSHTTHEQGVLPG